MNGKAEAKDLSYSKWDSYWEAKEHQPDHELKAYMAWAKGSSKFQSLIKYLSSYFGTLSGISTIELGCGEANYSIQLASMGAKPLCVDYSQAALQRARRNFSVMGMAGDFLQGDIENMPKALMGKFDVCLSFGTVEHYLGVDRLNIVKLHYSLVRPGGIVIISVPNRWCFSYRLWLYLMH